MTISSSNDGNNTLRSTLLGKQRDWLGSQAGPADPVRQLWRGRDNIFGCRPRWHPICRAPTLG